MSHREDVTSKGSSHHLQKQRRGLLQAVRAGDFTPWTAFLCGVRVSITVEAHSRLRHQHASMVGCRGGSVVAKLLVYPEICYRCLVLSTCNAADDFRNDLLKCPIRHVWY